MGVNHVGRNPDCDFQIDHSTVSSRHCELILSASSLTIRDCDSTNGTFVNDDPIKEATLQAGQTVRLGDVKLFVESAEVTISIPKFQQPAAVPVGVGSPVVVPAGVLVCPRHVRSLAIYKCTQCSEVMCEKCVRSIRRQGGQALFFCPLCNGKCARISAPPKKKTFLDTLRRTVKMPFAALSGRPRN
jgi:pSer/pThr/pTyr-binding forkhead associated (FHA) protein